MVSKLEINIRSLMSNCEELVSEEENFWRLRKYIKSLNTMIQELQETEDDNTNISQYKNRLESLKTTTNFVESPPNQRRLKSKIKERTTGEDVLKEMNQLQESKYYLDLRKELMNDDNLRLRKPQNEENMGQAMKYFTDQQEKITEDMLALTRSLKEQTETANKIIKRDTEIVTKSTQISENNIGSLSKEAEKLQDHSRRAWKCWMWLMIGLVMVIFIFMVLFMKIMKKRA
uniref:Vesicle transport protein USE1 n=1 Tax=Tabanus bromius TaxID=304241 RepID=A0A0K8TTI2_TABBR